MESTLIKKEHVKALLKMYFCQKSNAGHCLQLSEAEEDLPQLLEDLLTFDLQEVQEKLEKKRYWDAAEILKEGWK